MEVGLKPYRNPHTANALSQILTLNVWAGNSELRRCRLRFQSQHAEHRNDPDWDLQHKTKTGEAFVCQQCNHPTQINSGHRSIQADNERRTQTPPPHLEQPQDDAGKYREHKHHDAADDQIPDQQQDEGDSPKATCRDG